MTSLLTIISSHSTGIITTLIVIFFLLSVFVVFLFYRYRQLSKTLAYLLRGKKALSLEDVIIGQSEHITAIENKIQSIDATLLSVRKCTNKSLYKKSLMRYNPFKDLGGDQSFVISLLDGDNDGIVISSLHTTDGTRIYAKSVVNGVSQKHKLSDEEKVVIEDAKKQNITID